MTAEEPFYEIEHLPTTVYARRITKRTVITTPHGKITLEEGDIELIDLEDGSKWGNTPKGLLRRYRAKSEKAQKELFDPITEELNDDQNPA
jgi:hypothetical protein